MKIYFIVSGSKSSHSIKYAIVTNKVAAIPEYSENMVTVIHADPDDKDGLFKGAKYLIENP